MQVISLAWRNLLRNRRRSLTTLSAMIIGLTAVLIFGGYRSNINYGIETGFIQGSGHLQIQHQDYFREGGDNPASYGIADYQRIINAVKHDPVLAPMLTVVTPTLQLGGIAGNFSAGVSRSVLAIGVVPEDRAQIEKWNDYKLVSYVTPLKLVDASLDAVEIGEGVARKLKLCVELQIKDCMETETPNVANTDDQSNDAPADIATLSQLEQVSAPKNKEDTRIEMLAATAHGAPNVANLNVIGYRNMGIKALDDVYMVMHLEQAQKLIYGSDKPQVTAIQIQLHHTGQVPAAKNRLQTIIDTQFSNQPLEVLDFKTLNPMFEQTARFMNSMFSFISTLIGVIVLFTIGNTMSTAVVERTVEIGTLRAIGLRRSGLRMLFLCEGAILGLIGAFLGLLFAVVIAYVVNYLELSWIPPGYSHAYLILVLIGQDPVLLIGSVVGLIVVTIFSAWWPALHASRLVIVDALRHV